ncbi:hypothetical protein ACIQUG_08265 [Ensifer sp. NPDC090286]|uniref:hypothetical protein n=1 Tax=Ensifer sp. NPDC090286 TaxID=3363991 RepID=UPI00383AEAE8
MIKYVAFSFLALITGFGARQAYAEDLVLTFHNQTGEEHRGCVLLGYTSSGERKSSSIRPVPGNGSFTFRLPDCGQYKEWRFVAALDYSDKPENADVVLMDTGKRAVTKCDWTVTGKKGG